MRSGGAATVSQGTRSRTASRPAKGYHDIVRMSLTGEVPPNTMPVRCNVHGGVLVLWSRRVTTG